MNTRQDIPVVAYQHPTSFDCISSQAHTYANPRKLVLLDDVTEHIERLELDLGEWRTYATEAGKQLKDARGRRDELLEALTVLLDTPTCGPKSAGTWSAAEKKARAAIANTTGGAA